MERKHVFVVDGISCLSCIGPLERRLRTLEGVKEASINTVTHHLYVRGSCDPSEIVSRLRVWGYMAQVVNDAMDDPVHSPSSGDSSRSHYSWWIVGVAFLLSAPLCLGMLGMVVPEGFRSSYFYTFLRNPWLQFLLATVLQMGLGSVLYLGAYRSLRRGMFTTGVLVALSSTIAYGLSIYHQFYVPGAPVHYEEGALLLSFIWLGKAMESHIRGYSRPSLHGLLSLQAPTARLVRSNGEEVETPLDQVNVGDRVIVLPGERVPVDGVVLRGETMLDTSVLTGESLPRLVCVGDHVGEAMSNLTGRIEVRTEKIGRNTSLGRLIQAITTLRSNRPPLQRLVDRMVSGFAPVLFLMAIVAAAFSYVFSNPGDIMKACYVVAAVFVVACPCALGLAAPLATVCGVRRAAEQGLLIREGAVCETLAKVDTVVVDKTGTLTSNRPTVVAAHLAGGLFTERDLKRWVYATEKATSHPLARALVTWAEGEDSVVEADRSLTHPGMGVEATVEGHSIVIGTRELLQLQEVVVPTEETAEEARASGGTVVFLSVDSQYAGCFVIEDPLDTGAKRMILAWQQQGLQVVLLSGDHEKTVQSVGKELGISMALSQQSPEGKARFIGTLQEKGCCVAMIGDGINDTIALTAADVGVAVGGGTAAAREVADVVLLRCTSVQGFLSVYMIAKFVVRNIRQNVIWVFAYNSIGVLWAAFGQLPPWVAAAAMAVSTLCVSLNALRLLRIPIPSACS